MRLRLRLTRDIKINKIIIANLVNVCFSCYPLSNNQRVLIYNLIMIVTVKSGTSCRFFSDNLSCVS